MIEIEEGNKGPTITKEHLESIIVDKAFMCQGTYTICLLTLKNGYKVHGASSCVDPANFCKEKGQKYAYQRAFEKLWPLEGYLLAQRLHEWKENPI